MRVWVVMGNDYPAAVYDSERAAKEFCELKKKMIPHIYWRAYDFTVNAPQPL